METTIYHNPASGTVLDVPPHAEQEFLFIIDKPIAEWSMTVRLGEKSQASILGWVLADNETDIPLRVRIEHVGNNSNGSARVRSILRGNSRNTFTGNVVIPNGVKDVESFLEYRSILFDHARATATPALEIEEHPLKAGHAATIGRVDEDQLFYLQSRGLSEAESTELITSGFFAELIDAIADEQKKEEVRNLLHQSAVNAL